MSDKKYLFKQMFSVYYYSIHTSINAYIIISVLYKETLNTYMYDLTQKWMHMLSLCTCYNFKGPTIEALLW